LFDVHELEKDYFAIVDGRIDGDAGRIDAPLGSDTESENGVKMTTRADGAPSLTTYTVLERFADASAVRFRIHTGRQHQIRVHALALGHPVLLDPLYGSGPTKWPADGEPVIARQALHAERLALRHPITRAALDLRAAFPADLEGLLTGLRTSED
jgi:23S rRNA pseudouridine1911/1915/1917 synthase